MLAAKAKRNLPTSLRAAEISAEPASFGFQHVTDADDAPTREF